LVGEADEGRGALAGPADAFACHAHVVDGAPAMPQQQHSSKQQQQQQQQQPEAVLGERSWLM
jgi:hypothetical protein